MKVIFQQDYQKIKKGTIDDVSDGLAKNMLIPKNIAIPASTENVRKHEASLRKQAESDKKEIELITFQKKELESAQVSILKVKTAAGHMQGRVTKKDFVKAIEEQLNISVNPKKVELPKMQSFSIFTATIKLGRGIVASVKTEVVS